MIRRLFLVLLLAASAQSARAAMSDLGGMTVGFGLTHVELPRLTFTAKGYAPSSPLAYTPLEVGYRWPNGAQVKAGLGLFFYTAESQALRDDGTLDNQLVTHEYSATQMSLAVLYEVQAPWIIRPYGGLTVDLITTTRQARTRRLWNPSTLQWDPSERVIGEKDEEAWSMTGSAAVLGIRWPAGDHWSLKAEGRYLLPYGGDIPAIGMVGLGLEYEI